ncbi:CbiQ family ECF transporter T component [Roseateles terrae]|uniref:Cobalt/nickel transport system permease protein n=1 Tax=Roseateles terrae TaxID=431060 RepID=A0ABR6GUZ1_9BURK|nr:CbiQ family ECF transporter T component [Roseateles terrae]MBB3195492.1 cobalt/nickel transport system permease protein [Roseateles terrae]OWQ86416.1 hypothetical protein CDN98_11690 [Roseateles terrae]
MTLERLAYASPWRHIAPSAKALFCSCAMAAAWIAATPVAAIGLALLLAVITLGGARTPWRAYLRVLTAPVGFLALSCVTMLVTVSPGFSAASAAASTSASASAFPTGSGLAWRIAPELLPQVLMTVSRAAALCTALLLLVLSTPLGDLLGLMRRLRVPPLLLDLMVLAYRMQAVLGEAWSDGLTAQRSRLGYGGRRQALRSMALLISCLAVQVWARASALQAAADARNATDELRFLTPQWAQGSRHVTVALGSGLLMIALVLAARIGGAA